MRRGTRTRLRWGSVLSGAVIVTLVRPASWAFGLAGYLAGGGLVILSWPILVLPTPTGLQNALGSPLSTLVIGTPSTAMVALIAGGIVGIVAIVLGGTAVGAWAERQGILTTLEAAAEDGLVADPPDLAGAPGAARITVLRLLSLVPVLVASLLAWPPLYDAAYRELILPDDLVTPLPIRVIRAVPGPLLGIVITWLLADTAAAVGVRRLVLERRGIVASWALGWVAIVRRPHRVLATALVGTGALAVIEGPSLLAAGVGWGRVRDMAASGPEPPVTLVAIVVWVAIWLGGLVLAGVGAAFRSAAMTLEDRAAG